MSIARDLLLSQQQQHRISQKIIVCSVFLAVHPHQRQHHRSLCLCDACILLGYTAIDIRIQSPPTMCKRKVPDEKDMSRITLITLSWLAASGYHTYRSTSVYYVAIYLISSHALEEFDPLLPLLRSHQGCQAKLVV